MAWLHLELLVFWVIPLEGGTSHISEKILNLQIVIASSTRIFYASSFFITQVIILQSHANSAWMHLQSELNSTLIVAPFHKGRKFLKTFTKKLIMEKVTKQSSPTNHSQSQISQMEKVWRSGLL